MQDDGSIGKNVCNGKKPRILACRLVWQTDIDSVVSVRKGKMNGVIDSLGRNADQGIDHVLHADAFSDDLLTIDSI